MNLTARIATLFRSSGNRRNDSGRAAMPAVSRGSKGSGAPSSRRAPIALIAALATILALALTPALALAAPPTTTTPVVSNASYGTAEAEGKVTTDGSGAFNLTAYSFQVSTDNVNWTTAASASIGGGAATNKEVKATLGGLKSGTKYFARLTAENYVDGGPVTEAISPGPNPSFTTLTADPPKVLLVDSASEVEYTTAKVTGKILRPEKSDNVACHFEYITDAQFTGNPSGDKYAGATSVPCEPEESVATIGEVPVSASLTGLVNATTYHQRLVVSNAGPTTDAKEGPTFTTLTVDPPSVKSIDNASEVEYTTAKVKGIVERPATSPDPAFDLNCNFEYVTDAQFTANPVGDKFAGATPVACEPKDNPGENPIHAEGETEVEATLTGLVSTTYHLRLSASNLGGTDSKEAAATFTTLTVDPPSVLAIGAATGIDQDSAKVSGEVSRPANPDPAFDVNCRFQYVTEADFQGDEEQSLTIAAEAGTYTIGFEGQSTAPLALNATPASIQLALESLSAIGVGDVSVGGGLGGKYGASPYLIVFHGALAGKDVEALTVNPGALKSGPSLEFGGRATVVTKIEGGNAPGFANPGEATCEPEAEPGESPIHVEGPSKVNGKLAGLTPDTTYHLRLSASNPGGSDAKVAASTFTTSPNLPASAVVGLISEVSYSRAKLSGEIDSEGVFSFPVFQVSTDGVNWINASHEFGGNYQNTKLEPISPLVITGLEGGTKYFVRLRIAGANNGEPDPAVSPPPYSSFTTLPVQAPAILSANNATEVGHESAKVSGEIERPANPDPAFDANCRFEYVTDAKFDATGFQGADQVPCGIDSLTTPEEKKAVEAKLTDLKAGTEYHVRLTATNAGPDASVEIAPFTTTTILATVKTAAGASDGKAGYTLQGIVNPNNSALSGCEFVYGPNSGLIPSDYAFAVPCSPLPGMVNKPVTVEGHVTGLTPNATYHARLVVSNKAGTKITEDQIFIPTLDPAETCPNEQLRKENSSLALPECRAYEKVSPAGKEGFDATFKTFDGGERVNYYSPAGNIAKSGGASFLPLPYVARRTGTEWETIPNLNGSSGSIFDAPSNILRGGGFAPAVYSKDLLSSIWETSRAGDPVAKNPDGSLISNTYLRNPDGTFTFLAGPVRDKFDASDDLSHVVQWRVPDPPFSYGEGVYEFVGTNHPNEPRRVDLDNTGSPISTCGSGATADSFRAISGDGRVIFFSVFGGCGGANPPADEIWARVNGTTSVDVSASQCNRTAADPGGVCNAPAKPVLVSFADDGSRVFFTTTQQLVNGDTDEADDLYACDIPAGTPEPVGKANSCTALRLVSVGETGAANFENVSATSADGSTVYFVAKGVLAANEDALKGKAVAGDHNLYVWRTDAANPAGRTTFIGKLDSNDVGTGTGAPPTTSDGRFLVFSTTSQLLETDTDIAREVYRFDVETGQLTRVSTNFSGVGGNGGGFDASIGHGAVSDDGQKIVFTSTEALSPSDGNGEADAYLWTPTRVYLISTGAVGGGVISGISNSSVTIDGSGHDIYFNTPGALTPADGDAQVDVYDARIGGGFSFATPPICAGEDCQPERTPVPPKPNPGSGVSGPGNPAQPKPCSKGKVRNKKGKCVKKPKRHSGKKHHGKKAGHKQGGGK